MSWRKEPGPAVAVAALTSGIMHTAEGETNMGRILETRLDEYEAENAALRALVERLARAALPILHYSSDLNDAVAEYRAYKEAHP